MPGRFRGVYLKMVMVNMVFSRFGTCRPGWHGPAAGHSIPCFSWMTYMPGTLIYKRSSSPIRSGGGGPYHMVRIRCESGVRIKIPESGFKNPDPDAFAFSLLWFADPDHVRIRNHLHFLFWWIFPDPDPRIWIRVRVTPNSFLKILNMIFLKENSDPRLPLDGSVHVVTILA